MSIGSSKFISFREILEKVYADNQYTYELPVADAVTWMADCMELIGHPDQYELKVTGHKEYTPFDITNYRAELPCGFLKLKQIAVDGFPAFPANHSFHNLMDGDCCGLDDVSSILGDTFTDNFNNEFNTALGTRYQSEPVTYSLNNDFITLSNKEGKVCMSYWSIMLDDEGYPLVPDDVSYRNAVTWYITHKLDYISWRKGEISDKVFENSKQEYDWYVAQASGKAKMPDVDKMENMKNQLLRLKPNPDHYSGFFKYLSTKEARKIK